MKLICIDKILNDGESITSLGMSKILDQLNPPSCSESEIPVLYELKKIFCSDNPAPQEFQTASDQVRSAIRDREPFLVISSTEISNILVLPTFFELYPTGGLLELSSGIHLVSSNIFLKDSQGSKNPRPLPILLAGTRIRSLEEASIIRSNGIRSYPMKLIIEEGIQETTHAIMESCRAYPALFIIINLNVLDPAFAPGLLNPAPGGLSTRELTHLVQKLLILPTVRGIQITGYNPNIAMGQETVNITCALAREIIGSLPHP